MKIITIANRKGGTGKSTVTYNLAFSYALKGKRVLLIDLDSQGNLSLLCNVSTIELDEFKSCKIQKLNKSIDLLPATKRFKMLENEINGLIDRNAYIKTKILPKIDKYDYVLIDTPPASNILNVNAFCISDYIYIIINPDYFSLSGLVEMKSIIKEIKTINVKLEYRIILNAYFTGRKFLDNVNDILKNEEYYTGIEIPHRQYIITASSLKKPAIDNIDIQKPFNKLANLV